MVPYVVVLRWGIHNKGHFLGGGGVPKNRDFLGPEMATSGASAIRDQKK
jgi:hypothetical protein